MLLIYFHNESYQSSSKIKLIKCCCNEAACSTAAEGAAKVQYPVKITLKSEWKKKMDLSAKEKINLFIPLQNSREHKNVYINYITQLELQHSSITNSLCRCKILL